MAEITPHNRIHHAGLRFFNPTPFHAVVLRLDQNRQALRFTEALNLIG